VLDEDLLDEDLLEAIPSVLAVPVESDERQPDSRAA